MRTGRHASEHTGEGEAMAAPVDVCLDRRLDRWVFQGLGRVLSLSP